MRGKNIGPGIFLITIGLVIVLFNYGLIDWRILHSVAMLWPLLLVAAGINVIFRKNLVVRPLVWVLLLAVLVVHSQYYVNRTVDKNYVKDIKVEKHKDTKNADLKLDLGNMDLNLTPDKYNLVSMKSSESDLLSDVSYDDGKNTAHVKVKKNKFIFPGGRGKAELSISRDVEWNVMKFDVGAFEGKADLSDISVKKIDIDSGLTDLDLKLGPRNPDMEIDIDAGLSDIKINLPKNSGVKIRMDGALNDTNFGGINLTKNGDTYISQGYENAAVKFNFKIDMGLGDIKFSEY